MEIGFFCIGHVVRWFSNENGVDGSETCNVGHQEIIWDVKFLDLFA